MGAQSFSKDFLRRALLALLPISALINHLLEKQPSEAKIPALPSFQLCQTREDPIQDKQPIIFSICVKKQQAGQQILHCVINWAYVYCSAICNLPSTPWISISSSLRRSLSQIRSWLSCEAQKTHCPTKEGITVLQEAGRRRRVQKTST